jgi:branched-chain amino acid transport system permease protein
MKTPLALVAALLLLPQVVQSDFVLTIFVFTFILGIAAVSFNLIFGFTGQLSLFHAAAFGISAYVTHIAMTTLSIPFWAGVGCAVLFVLALSTIIGAICFRYRLKEFYFAVVTLAFAEMARLVVLNWNEVTNGSLGIALIDKPTLWVPGVGQIVIGSTYAWYYVGLVALMVTLLVCHRVLASWIGRCFGAIRLNDELASTLGINVFRYKLLSFAIGNAFAAVAGALYAWYIGYIEPEYLGIPHSLALISMVLLGGSGSLVGPVVGALVLTALPHLIQFSAEARVMAYGAILIFAILVLPQGIWGAATMLWKRLFPAPRVAGADGAPASTASDGRPVEIP